MRRTTASPWPGPSTGGHHQRSNLLRRWVGSVNSVAASTASARRPHAATSSSSGRLSRGRCRRQQRSRCRHPRQRPPQHLAPLAKGRAHQRKQPRGRIGRRGWARAPLHRHQHRLHPGLGDEYRCGHPTDNRCCGPIRQLHRRNAIYLGSGPGCQTLAHLALHHHQHRVDGRHLVEQMQDHGGSHVVGQVGHQLPGPPLARTGRPVQLQRIAVHHRDVAVGASTSASTGSKRMSASTATTSAPVSLVQG